MTHEAHQPITIAHHEHFYLLNRDNPINLYQCSCSIIKHLIQFVLLAGTRFRHTFLVIYMANRKSFLIFSFSNMEFTVCKWIPPLFLKYINETDENGTLRYILCKLHSWPSTNSALFLPQSLVEWAGIHYKHDNPPQKWKRMLTKVISLDCFSFLWKALETQAP